MIESEPSVLDRLGAGICSGQLPPGALLYLTDLSTEFGVAQSVVREAMKVLSAMGLVESRRRRGTVVLPQSEWNLFDPRIIEWRLACHQRANQLQEMLELRMAIEPVAAKLAAVRMAGAELADFAAAADAFFQASLGGDEQTFLAADIDFHKKLLLGSKNPMLIQLDELVSEVLSARHKYRLMPAVPNPDSVRLHLVVADSIMAREPEAAAVAARVIVERASTEMSLILEQAKLDTVPE